MAHKSKTRATLGARILRIRDVMDFTGKRLSAIQRDIANGEFPKPIPLNDSGRSKGWLEEELIAWRERQIQKRNAGAAAKKAVRR